jgi:hypothetical protein
LSSSVVVVEETEEEEEEKEKKKEKETSPSTGGAALPRAQQKGVDEDACPSPGPANLGGGRDGGADIVIGGAIVRRKNPRPAGLGGAESA